MSGSRSGSAAVREAERNLKSREDTIATRDREHAKEAAALTACGRGARRRRARDPARAKELGDRGAPASSPSGSSVRWRRRRGRERGAKRLEELDARELALAAREAETGHREAHVGASRASTCGARLEEREQHLHEREHQIAQREAEARDRGEARTSVRKQLERKEKRESGLEETLRERMHELEQRESEVEEREG